MEKKTNFTDHHFFTNEGGVSLLDRFRTILEHDTQRFDVIVGYFYITGFYKLWKSLENVEKIRIIVGMGTDEETLLLSRTESIEGSALLREKIRSKIAKEFEYADTSFDIDEGINRFIDYINTKKLEIRGFPSQKLHAKVYIMIKKENSEDYGKVITGSSNFTTAGLLDNLEFNVELKDYADVKFAEEKFNEMWENSIPLNDEFIKTINESTYFRKITPYEIYLKTLYEYFQDRIDFDLKDIDLPEKFKKFRFQIEAVLQLKSKLEEHGGAFLSDVVGLGKTVVASILSREMLDYHPLVICPPELTEYWKSTMWQFGVYPETVSAGMLTSEHFNINKFRNFKLVFIDESHRFRNELTKGYEVLHELCSGKKVVLISATPLNNSPTDLANQIYLFEDKFNSTIPGLKNLKRFFEGISREYDELKSKRKSKSLSENEFQEIANKIAKEIREKVLNHLMVRRTRKDIQKYFRDDIEKRKLQFPKVEDPKPIFYELDEKLNELFEESVKVIASSEGSKRLTYAAYRPFKYLNEEGKEKLIKTEGFNVEKIEFQQRAENFLAGLMKVLYLKRLDSSFYSFKESLKNMINRYDFLIKKYDQDGIVLYANTDKVIQKLDNKNIDEGELKDIISANSLNANYFHKKYREDLEKDKTLAQELLKKWESVKNDPKIEKIVSLLKSDSILGKEKILIFTEFEDTLDYLESELKKVESLKGNFIAVSSKTEPKVFDEAIRNFDRRQEKHEDKYRILIGTDVLSEGLNLDDAKAVVNFDIPWNPTKIIQRFGRINRIDTPGEIYIYNFFPAEKTEREIHLRSTATSKIELFINTLGADSKYLTEFDPSNPTGIFSLMNSKALFEEFTDEEENEELKYLNYIRKVRDENASLYEKIKHLPLKARGVRKGEENKVITFFKVGNLPKFYLSTQSKTVELSPLEAIKQVECKENEPALEIEPFFYEMFGRNEEAFKEYLKKEEVGEFQKSLSPSEKGLLLKIKGIEGSLFTHEDREYLDTLYKAIVFGSIGKSKIIKANNEVKNVNDEKQILKILKQNISPQYVFSAISENNNNRERKVILSSVFKEVK